MSLKLEERDWPSRGFIDESLSPSVYHGEEEFRLRYRKEVVLYVTIKWSHPIYVGEEYFDDKIDLGNDCGVVLGHCEKSVVVLKNKDGHFQIWYGEITAVHKPVSQVAMMDDLAKLDRGIRRLAQQAHTLCDL